MIKLRIRVMKKECSSIKPFWLEIRVWNRDLGKVFLHQVRSSNSETAF